MNNSSGLYLNKPHARLAVIIPSLAGGGMERMRIHLIKEWIRQGINIDLVVARRKGPLCDLIPEEVQIFETAGNNSLLFPFGLVHYLKKRKPTHILSAANDINAITLLAVKLMGLKSPTVISVHNHLSSELRMEKGIKKVKLQIAVWMLRRLIHSSQGVISISKGVEEDLKLQLNLKSSRSHVVYNPVITSETRNLLKEPLNNSPVPEGVKWILFAGRFVHAKGLDILISAFAQMINDTNAHLVLMGEGPLKPDISERIRKMSLSQRVHLVGYQSNPLPWMREADVFVLPSRHEGLSNVIIEAMASGTQIVATDCPSGPAEILEDGKYGQLVPVENIEALSRALLKSLNSEFRVPTQKLENRSILFTSSRAAELYKYVLNGKWL